MEVQGIDPQFRPARNTAAKIGNTEAAFPIFNELFIQHGDVGIGAVFRYVAEIGNSGSKPGTGA